MKTICFILLGLFQLSCNQKMSIQDQQKLPYEINEVYYQSWIAGIQGGGSGTNLCIKFKNQFPEGVSLSKIYFQNKEAIPEIEKENLCIARFKGEANQQQTDLQLDVDPKKEYGNTIPQEISKFKLEKNEAILEFTNKGKKELFKITEIKEKELEAYPSAKPRN